MSQLINQGLSIASPSDAPMKRRRGRPPKDDTPAVEKSSPTRRPNLKPLSACTQGEASSAAKATASIASKGKDMMQVDADLSADDDYNNDEMVGQVVTGVLECAFDAGYFLRVRIGNSNVYMRGVVFKEGCVVPVTPENDIAPNAKMYKRRDIPIPVSFTPQVPQNAGMSISKPTENFAEHRQQAQPHTDAVSQKECQNVVVETASNQQDTDAAVNIEQQQDTDIAVNIEQQQQQNSVVGNLSNVASEKQDILNSEPAVVQDQATNQTDMETVEGGEDGKVLEPSAPVQNGVPAAVLGEDNVSDQSEEEKAETEPASADMKQKEDSTKAAGLEDSSERPVKIQKTGEVIAACSNGQLFKDIAAGDENHVKCDEGLTTIALPVEAIIPPEPQVTKTEPVAPPTVMEQQSCDNAVFEIRMENGVADDLLSEPLTEVSAMETE